MRRLGTAKRVTAALFLALSAGAAGAAIEACRVFELGDVVPSASDAAASDGTAAGDGTAASDGTADAACVDSGDPCACLPAPFAVSPELTGVGQSLALAGQDVYFLSTGSGGGSPTVYRAPRTGTGGAAPAAATPASVMANSMVAASPWLFFRRINNPAGILRLPLGAPTETPPAYVSPLLADPVDLATDGARIYWTNSFGAVCAAPIDGAPAVQDAGPSGCGAPPIVAARDGGPAAAQLAVNATSVFVTYNAHVYAAPMATGALVQIANLAGYSVGGLTEESGRLFWAAWNTDAGGIASAEDDGGGAKLVVASALEGRALQAAFAVDADGLYWGARTYTKLWASARDGSGVRLLACDPSGAAAVATDATNVYWLTNDGAVKRVAKR